MLGVPPACLRLAAPEIGAQCLGGTCLALGAGPRGGGGQVRFGFRILRCRGLGHGRDLRRGGGGVNEGGVAPDIEAAYEAAARLGRLL
jgi:hypothetical protein